MVRALQIFGYYSLLLTITGTIGNILMIIVCLQSHNNPTFALIKYLALNDMLSLYFWNLSHFTFSVFDLDLQNFNIVSCKIGNWIQFSSLQTSAWILVILSLERYLSFKIQNWRTKFFNPKIASNIGLSATILFYTINFNTLFFFGYESIVNGTKIVQCYTTIENGMTWMNIWEHVHSFLYSFLPFITLAIINFLLIKFLMKSLRNSQITGTNLNIDQLSISTTVISITLFFIILTAPGAICSQFYNSLIQTENGKVILFASDSVTFSYHALNIIFLCLSNKEFYGRLKKTVLRKRDSVEVTNITTRRALCFQSSTNMVSIK